MVIGKGKIRWFGRVERNDDADCIKRCMKVDVSNKTDGSSENDLVSR